jgi:uncharacterized protein
MNREKLENTSQGIIEKTAQFVRRQLENAEGGHDWNHIERVRKVALHIANAEQKGDLLVIELAALLHDIADAKFHNGDETIGPRMAGEFLQSVNLHEDLTGHVINIIEHISFRKRFTVGFDSIELRIVQDADRLDAIGALGIARAFSYGGFKNRPLYDPDNVSSDDTIGHFYEKLLLISKLMNTETAKKLAFERHEFMEKFLEQFYKEWYF